MRGSGTASSSLPRPRQSERPRRVLPSDRSPWRKHRGPPGSSPGSANVVRLVGADAGEEMAEHLRLAGRGSVLSVETQAQTLGWKGRPRRQGPAETGRDAGRVAGRSARASRWRPLCRNGLQAAFPKPAGPTGALLHPHGHLHSQTRRRWALSSRTVGPPGPGTPPPGSGHSSFSASLAAVTRFFSRNIPVRTMTAEVSM